MKDWAGNVHLFDRTFDQFDFENLLSGGTPGVAISDPLFFRVIPVPGSACAMPGHAHEEPDRARLERVLRNERVEWAKRSLIRIFQNSLQDGSRAVIMRLRPIPKTLLKYHK